MTIWFIFAFMTGAVVLAVLVPLSRQRAAVAIVDDAAFFRSQIADIDSEAARGLMPAAEVESARAEAGRRLLRAVAQTPAESDQKGEPALRRRRAASAIAVSLIPLVALTVYGTLGQPHVADAPLAARLKVDPGRDPDIGEVIARIEGHLARQADDWRGWELLAPVYMRMGRFEQAAHAFRETIRHDGETAQRLSGLGEALVMADGGIVSADARLAFERALALDPASDAAAYYLGVVAGQDGTAAP
ncbi:c-type cytochrome biogenesis protein CcmI [Pseudochelatococcus contaminans]|uniref:Cytochrome c-type biogenesis protein CcmI n=1 Tax=Pseudochelatococcus contaminans TaxID=1538103 RepID=A0A7W5Z465_9HYPH|nr:c-type cytochrome biogenesis protein CcmI [Pseudochelatococcus contaminans]MBB3809831.1 cytochrome c-type biogenesis protein CcmI [Pseudochelatococcus contaminans]